MNNKKTRNKIYHYIDFFFIFAPILLLVGWFCFLIFNSIFSGSNLKGYTQSFNFTDLDSVSQFFDYVFDRYFCLTSGFYDSWIDNVVSVYSDSGYVFNVVYDALETIFDAVFGDTLAFWFFRQYMGYIICYELVSLFINILLWIPRYIRSWIQEKGVNV